MASNVISNVISISVIWRIRRIFTNILSIAVVFDRHPGSHSNLFIVVEISVWCLLKIKWQQIVKNKYLEQIPSAIFGLVWKIIENLLKLFYFWYTGDWRSLLCQSLKLTAFIGFQGYDLLNALVSSSTLKNFRNNWKGFVSVLCSKCPWVDAIISKIRTLIFLKNTF